MDAVTPWPEWLTNSFVSANQPENASDKNAYYAPYMRLLYHLFGNEGPFEVSLKFDIPDDPCEGIDVVALFTVELINRLEPNKRPVLFLEINAPAPLAFDTKRKQAEERMCDLLQDLREYPGLVTPRIPGIIAFGTRMAFYECVVATNKVTPRQITPDPVFLNGLAPVERWGYDVFQAKGIAQLRRVAEDVKAMC
jgi:hypothetical protein